MRSTITLMAKRKTKSVEVKKFGGVDDLGSVKELNNKKQFHSYLSDKDFDVPDVNWDAKSVEAESTTTLEMDQGGGGALIIRDFKFKIDPTALTECFIATQTYPDKQMLFNSVVKFIEASLWQDGLKVFPDVEPRVLINENYTEFDVFVGSVPQKGQRLLETPKTLSQLVNG